MHQSLIGQWKGRYVYGNGYEEHVQGKAVEFLLEILEDDDLIRGTCIDDETKNLFKTPATIEGTFENNTIVFYKTYPLVFDLDDDDKAFIAEYETPPSIQYSGILKQRIYSKTLYFEGTWEISGSYLAEDGKAEYYELEGKWRMNKVN